jgi:regulatory protein
VAVYLDGRHALDLSAMVASDARLHKDDVLTEERQRALLKEDEPYRAREAALRMLGRREMSGRELANKLSGAGFSEGAAAQTVEWTRERGYVDDRRFAAAYAADRLKAGWGRQRIMSELVRKGIDRGELSGEAWNELLRTRGAADDIEQLVGLVRRRFGGQLRADPESAGRRINGFLARRGHDWDTVAAVLKAVKEDVDPDDDRRSPALS